MWFIQAPSTLFFRIFPKLKAAAAMKKNGLLYSNIAQKITYKIKPSPFPFHEEPMPLTVESEIVHT